MTGDVSNIWQEVKKLDLDLVKLGQIVAANHRVCVNLWSQPDGFGFASAQTAVNKVFKQRAQNVIFFYDNRYISSIYTWAKMLPHVTMTNTIDYADISSSLTVEWHAVPLIAVIYWLQKSYFKWWQKHSTSSLTCTFTKLKGIVQHLGYTLHCLAKN